MSEARQPHEVIELLMHARDPDATDDARERLNALLRSDAGARAIVSRFLADEASLVLSLKSESIADFVADELLVLPGESAARGHPLRSALLTSARWRVAALAAVLALLAGVAFLMLPKKDTTILRIAQLNGSFRWTGDGGRVVEEPVVGGALGGGTLESMTTDSSAVLVFHDGSRVTVSGQAQLTVADFGQKKLWLQGGVLSADVAKQPPGKPMRIYTPSAEAEVVGTRLDVDALPLSTRVTVNEGHVRVKRLADGSVQEVPADHLVVAGFERRTPFEARPLLEHTDTWKSTLPEDARFGKWVPGTNGEPGLLRAEPQMWKGYAQPTPVLQFVASVRVSSGDSAPAQLDASSRIRVRGRLNSSHDVLFGFTSHHDKGGFAGRYVCWRKIDVGADSGGSFEVEIPVTSFFKGEPNFPPSPIGHELFDWFSITRQEDVGLKIESVELLK